MRISFISLLCIVASYFLTYQSLSAQQNTDSLALVALYHATDGPNWTVQTNWLAPGIPIEDWHGIATFPNGKVAVVNLRNNNLSGALPDSIGLLDQLFLFRLDSNAISGAIPDSISNWSIINTLDLSHNQLTGGLPVVQSQGATLSTIDLSSNQLSELPDLSSAFTNLAALHVQNNQLTYEDIEPNLSLPLFGQQFTYAPQDSVLEKETHVLDLGSDLTLTSFVPGSKNVYQWKKDGVIIPGANEATYSITNVAYEDAGVYSCVIESDSVLLLTLNRKPIVVDLNAPPISVNDSLALVGFYNALNGANWIDNSNWLAGRVFTWKGVQVGEDRVVGLALSANNLTGKLPTIVGNLDQLRRVDLSNNQLEGAFPAGTINWTKLDSLNLSDNELDSMPDLSDVGSLNWLNMRNNRFTFKDISPNIGGLVVLYSPQDSLFEAESYVINLGDDLTLNAVLECPTEDFCLNDLSSYTWRKNGAIIQSGIEGTFQINDADISDAGTYTCSMTHPTVNNLTLWRKPIEVAVDAVTSLNGNSNTSLFSVAPNPAIDVITFQVEGISETGVVRVFGPRGDLVLDKQVQRLSETTLEISALNSGIYQVVFQDQSGKIFNQRTIINSSIQ